MYNLRYLIIAAGGPQEPPVTDQDMEDLKRIVDGLTGKFVQANIVSERVGNKITVALLQERGVL